MKTSKMCAIFSNQHEYSRLKPLTDERALSTLYFAGKYRLMDFALSSIVNADINHVYTLISQEKVRSYLGPPGRGQRMGAGHDRFLRIPGLLPELDAAAVKRGKLL